MASVWIELNDTSLMEDDNLAVMFCWPLPNFWFKGLLQVYVYPIYLFIVDQQGTFGSPVAATNVQCPWSTLPPISLKLKLKSHLIRKLALISSIFRLPSLQTRKVELRPKIMRIRFEGRGQLLLSMAFSPSSDPPHSQQARRSIDDYDYKYHTSDCQCAWVPCLGRRRCRLGGVCRGAGYTCASYTWASLY